MEGFKARIKNASFTTRLGILLGAAVLITLVLELFVFNFKWLSSALDKPIANPNMTASSTNVRITDIDQPIRYIRLDPGENNTAEITITARDESNANGISAPERVVSGDIKRTQYIRLHFSGKISELNIKTSAKLQNVELNARVPLMFSFWRFLLVLLMLLTLWALRPSSKLYSYKTDLKSTAQRLIALALVLIQAVFLASMIQWNKTALKWPASYEHHQQYYSLVDSIKHGHFDIGEDNGPLSEMANPYDKSERDRLGIRSKWDHAFYNGKYYVYFGIVPAMLFYLPYNLITGKNLPNYTVVYILCLLTIIGIMLLLWEVIKKWFKDTPFIVYLMLSVVFAAISLISYAVYKPDFYLVPIACAMMLAIFGLAFWLSAQTSDDKGAALSKSRLAIGSACMALTAGCRPQITIAAFLGIMLLWNAAFRQRLLFSKKSIGATAAVCAPFVIVAAGLMWYNAARFSSPFDFGANYNLTTNDMTHRGFVLGRIGLGAFTYLFEPISLNAVFPFLKEADIRTVYQGLTLTETMNGGAFLLFPVLTIGIYGVFSRRLFENRQTYLLVLLPMLMAVFIAVIDAQMAGLLARYYTDFVWLLMISASVTVFALFNKHDSAAVRRTVLILSALSLTIAFLRIFSYSADSIVKADPNLYHNIEHLIAFWM